MKLSTKGRYGLKVMHYLAKYQDDKPIPLSVVAGDLGLPENYLEQLMRKLKSNKLVSSTRGAYGGYTLVNPPGETYVGDILRALENSMSLTDCASQDNTCMQEDRCACRNVWKKIQTSINSTVDNYSLEDMIAEEEKQTI